MQTIEIRIVKDDIAVLMESLLWKYGSSIAGAENFKQVYNTQSSRTSNAVDARVINDSWEMRTQEALDIIRDFSPSVTEVAGEKTVSVQMSARWAGTPLTLKQVLDQYIVDSMMVDWLTVTAPSEAEKYVSRLVFDEKRIKANVYSLKRPSIT